MTKIQAPSQFSKGGKEDLLFKLCGLTRLILTVTEKGMFTASLCKLYRWLGEVTPSPNPAAISPGHAPRASETKVAD